MHGKNEHEIDAFAATPLSEQSEQSKQPEQFELFEPPDPSELDTVPPSDPPDVSAMNHEDAIEAMVSWFFENFEDPAHSTPWDGGYVYIWGGPYDAADEIYEAETVPAPACASSTAY